MRILSLYSVEQNDPEKEKAAAVGGRARERERKDAVGKKRTIVSGSKIL